MRPLLRPGVHVLQRGDGHLQLGLDPAGAVMLPDEPEVRGVLARFDGSAAPPGDLVDLLAADSMVIDEQQVMPLLGRRGSGCAPAAVAALARHRGEATRTAAERRHRTRLQPVGFGPGGPELVTSLRELSGRLGIAPAAAAPGRAPLVGALAGVGEPERELADAWTQAGTPYVVVRLTEGRAVVGPFVVPGETACLRCVDAHHTDADRAWPLLVHQYSRAVHRERGDGVPEPVDPALAALAVAWAMRDVASYLDGLRPSTSSATLTLDAGLSAIESRCWPRHPECGCAWR